MSNIKYYDLAEIDGYNAKINVVFGERGNGKTSAVMERILKNWCEKGEQGVYLRRHENHIKPAHMKKVYSSIVKERDLVTHYSDGEWDDIVFWGGAWFLTKTDEETQKVTRQREPFCYAMAISTGESHKGGTEPNVTTVCFDEFISMEGYLSNEFSQFQNIISTIVRHRDNVTIYLMGNTISKWNPYFGGFGLKRARHQEKNTIDLYKTTTRHGVESLIVCHYCASDPELKLGKPSDVYFAFDNPTAGMILDGDWDLPSFPGLPFKTKYRDILDTFYILFDDRVLQGNIILKEDMLFIAVMDEESYESDKDNPETMFYSLKFRPELNHQVGVFAHPKNKKAKKIAELFRLNQVFYQDNEVGDHCRAYIEEAHARNATNL